MWPGAVKNISQSDLMCHPLPKKHKITYSKCIVFVPVGKNLVLDPELSGNHLQLFVFTWHQLVRKKHLRRSFSLSPCFKQWPNKAPMRSRPAITTSTSGCKESPRKKSSSKLPAVTKATTILRFPQLRKSSWPDCMSTLGQLAPPAVSVQYAVAWPYRYLLTLVTTRGKRPIAACDKSQRLGGSWGCKQIRSLQFPFPARGSR